MNAHETRSPAVTRMNEEFFHHHPDDRMTEFAGEPISDDGILALFSDYIRENTGISISPAKYHLLGTKLSRMVAKEGYRGVHEVYRFLRDGDERTGDLLIRYITTTYTYFFRESSQLDTLAREVKGRDMKRPLIWCAASSSGEEVYSIAIVLREAGVDEYLIMASDINPAVLRHMRRGIYKAGQFQYVPEDVRNRYFVPRDEERETRFEVRPVLRENIFIRRLNLLERIRFEDRFDFIFCRNVMIYFNAASRNVVLGTLERNLRRNGLLFLGKSESLLSNRLFARYEREPAVYRKQI